MNIIIRFCIVKKIQKLENTTEFTLKNNISKSFPIFLPTKENYHTKSLIIGIILHSQKVCNNDIDNFKLSSTF